MSLWRKRVGDAGAYQLLKKAVDAGLKLRAVNAHQLKRINVDTTVQEKEVRCPTGARLYDEAWRRIGNKAKKRGFDLFHNYVRL